MTTTMFSPELLLYSKRHNPTPPVHLGSRYRKVGGFLPEAGNTIVCHLEKGSQTQTALIEAREKYLAMPEAPQFLFTPISSIHMTLFEGVIETRRRQDSWPGDLPLDTPIEDMTALMAARLEGFSMFDPFKVAIVDARPSGLLVDGATENDRRVMRAWRNALADLLGYRQPSHEEYKFHMTFAYAIERLEDEALPRWQAMLDEVADDIRRKAPVLELTPPALCMFEDMNHFHELLIFDFEA
ncbi:DUF1868 domain-containing protein [Rhizobium leguminosarum]|jgi:hypothetical protein|uniref:DUF1868 domain-containing protein n=1 Tax=Rhizobium leguminosarum bv. trifolii TaxID=386 RepID=A0A1B8R443_RHILT|nr:DUF1868 domain-containing protein [Rhizobium leguminosarum]AOO93596.1 hypothetical protein [Rhizobium leguminosarum bv. trifolii]MBY5464600.1 DUF1868 domain-containing protein [Rhizobium leguminosarum]MBY5913937.1 DUF1868 domain-containing protein [Rhizobium leguminosarum]NKK90392.1 DUF1868 domain-containing protein [Rhizobium leguminosarum bv. viciae]OBY03559.1 hypothetical protein BAE36_29770 [Rhizobium leguminosarum bv. trifolii]